MERETTLKEQMEIAQLRFGMIAPVIQGTFTNVSIAAYCRRVAQTPVKLPDGRTLQYKPKTIEKWVNTYNQGGMDALVPKTRCDKGGTRVITEEAEQEIRRIRQEYPRLNATQIYDRLIREAILPATVSVSSVQRYLKRNGLKGEAGTVIKDRKAFEEAYFVGI